MSYTKGPWRFYTNPKTGIFLLSGGDKSKNQCFPVIYCKNSLLEPNNPTPEDAQLIAAAPEMYEALKDFVNACENAPPVELLQYIDRVCKKAKQAIAKAEGKSE